MRLSHVFRWRDRIRYWDVPVDRERRPPRKGPRRPQLNVLEHQARRIELHALQHGKRISRALEEILVAALDREEMRRRDAA